jgi:murein L,D-transpeptidase YcbB/YkuD
MRVVLTAMSAVLLTAAAVGVSPDHRTVLAESQVSLTDVALAIRADLDNPRSLGFTGGERAALRALYQDDGFLPVWLDARTELSPDARESVGLLARASEDGLDPADYGADELRVDAERAGRQGSDRDLARFDVELSRSMLCYLHDLRVGRVDARTPGVGLNGSLDNVDFPPILRAALVAHRISDTVNAQRPPLVQYEAMRVMLSQYRALQRDTTLEPLPFSEVVRPGDRHLALGVLQRWLVALGDLPKDATAVTTLGTFDGALVEGVRRFQVRHGLEPDGVLGRQTQAAFGVPLGWRVRQIELALERMRWSPRQRTQRLVIINIPMFRLWAFDRGAPDDAPSLTTPVVVGRAARTETPALVQSLQEVVFRPYWNVPPSILHHEILPALRRHSDYLVQQDMEIVRGLGEDARSVDVTAENLELLRQGALRLRQRPGSRNALGLIKFVFPNEQNVYLHATPAQALFKRSRRDFSHGCVRVEDAIGLAEWLLSDRPRWTRDRILEAMNGSLPLHVNVGQPTQVVLLYTTAAIAPEDRAIHFAEDIYGHDRALDKALAHRTRSIIEQSDSISLNSSASVEWQYPAWPRGSLD